MSNNIEEPARSQIAFPVPEPATLALLPELKVSCAGNCQNCKNHEKAAAGHEHDDVISRQA